MIHDRHVLSCVVGFFFFLLNILENKIFFLNTSSKSFKQYFITGILFFQIGLINFLSTVVGFVVGV